MLDTLIERLDKNKKILVLGEFIPVFPLFILRPDLNFTVSKPDRVSIGNRIFFLEKKTDYFYIKQSYDYIIVLSNDVMLNPVYKSVMEEEQIFYSQKGSIFKLRSNLN